MLSVMLQYRMSTRFDPTVHYSLQVSCIPCAHSALLGRRVHTDEDQISLLDGRVHISAEEEVPSPAFFDHVAQTRFKDGQAGEIARLWVWIRVPRLDSVWVDINDSYLDVRTAGSDDGASGPADIACADAADRANWTVELCKAITIAVAVGIKLDLHWQRCRGHVGIVRTTS